MHGVRNIGRRVKIEFRLKSFTNYIPEDHYEKSVIDFFGYCLDGYGFNAGAE